MSKKSKSKFNATLRSAVGELRRSGSAQLRALADQIESETPAEQDNQPTDPSGAPVQFDGVANPEPPKITPNGEEVPAVDTVPASNDSTQVFPAPTTSRGAQNPAEYIKAEALPSSEVNEANALDPVTGPLPANPEPAKPGVEDEVLQDQAASEPEADTPVKGAPDTEEHTSASRPTDTPEGSDSQAEVLPDPGTGKTGFKPKPVPETPKGSKYGAGIYKGTPNAKAAKKRK